jgi:hypothetical protein
MYIGVFNLESREYKGHRQRTRQSDEETKTETAQTKEKLPKIYGPTGSDLKATKRFKHRV